METISSKCCLHLKFLTKQSLKKSIELQALPHCHIHQNNELYYLCLHCGVSCCLGFQQEFSCLQMHIKRNPNHYFSLQIDLGGIWCSGCSDSIQNMIFQGDSKNQNEQFLKMNRFMTFVCEQTKNLTSKQGVLQRKSGPRGLKNLGNTCFLNVVLQSLKAADAFRGLYESLSVVGEIRIKLQKRFIDKSIQYFYDEMLEKKRSEQWNIVTNRKMKGSSTTKSYYKKQIKNAEFNILIKQFLKEMANEQNSVVKPTQILSYLEGVNQKYGLCQQQDAQQLLLTIIDLLSEGQRLSLISDKQRYTEIERVLGFQKLVPVQSIFGFYLLNQIQCNQCKQISSNISLSYNIGVSLEKTGQEEYQIIHKQSKIDIDYFEQVHYPKKGADCPMLDNFFKVQRLNLSNNFYSCTKCKSLLAYRKYYIISQPSVLIISVKRFSSNLQKNSIHYQFQECIDIEGYCASLGSTKYKLFAVIVHQGKSIMTGHYICFIKMNNVWFLCSDHRVQIVDWNYVRSQQAYMLLYEKQ